MSCLLPFGDPYLFEVHLKPITVQQVQSITIGEVLKFNSSMTCVIFVITSVKK